jgi:hypothetical protein
VGEVRRCDQSGDISDSLNPDGWLKITLRPYGNGIADLIEADVSSLDNGIAWLAAQEKRLAGSGVAPATVEVVDAAEPLKP